MPFLGICLGMHCAVVEFARNVCNLSDANSSEYDQNTKHPVVDKSPDQRNVQQLGGTMCLGNWPIDLTPGSLAMKAYGTPQIRSDIATGSRSIGSTRTYWNSTACR